MTVIELLTDERRCMGDGPQTIPAPGQGCWSEGRDIWMAPTGAEDPRRVWWDHVTEGHCPLCKGRLDLGVPVAGEHDEGWMHCWACRWSVRMRTLP